MQMRGSKDPMVFSLDFRNEQLQLNKVCIFQGLHTPRHSANERVEGRNGVHCADPCIFTVDRDSSFGNARKFGKPWAGGMAQKRSGP